MIIDFTEKKVLVCGSSKGIGKAIALNFAESNAKVTCIARNKELLKSIVDENPNLQISYIPLDFNDYENALNVLAKEIENNNDYDIIVNNSGGPKPGKLVEARIEEFVTAFNSHLFFSHRLMQIALPYMIKNKFGRFINIISVGLKQPVDNLGVSNTLRGAMGSWAKTLSKELGNHGITVNNLLPGQINTERLRDLIEHQANEDSIHKNQIIQNMIKNIPAGKIGNPNDLANMALFLASEFASFVNGASIPIDGGFLKSI